MFTLLSEIHFWTTQDDVTIKDTDYGAFKYIERKDEKLDFMQSKRVYTEKRKYVHSVTNKRPFKLKDKLKELEDLLAQNKVVYYKWTDHNVLQIMLCSGIFIYIFVNARSGDVEKITFDKFLVGKLQTTNCISDVLKTKSHLLCAYNDNRITLVQFIKKPLINDAFPQKLSRLEPRLQVCELAGPSGRRLERKMSSNLTGDRLLVWWKSTTDEVYPWSPLVKDQDRANIHVYSLYGSKLELQCFKRTEFDPLEIIFDIRQSNLIHCVEQKVSRRGSVSVEVATFEIIRNKLQQNHVTSIPLQTQVSCHALSPDEGNKLALGCIDGSVVIFDRIRGVTSLVKAAFIPTLCSWYVSNSFLYIANERSQIQCFDLSLACIKNQLIAEDSLPNTILDLTSYFKLQPTLSHFSWNSSCNSQNCDSLVVLLYERGPIAILRLFDYGGLTLNPSNLVSQYVQNGNIEKSLNILLSLDWNTNPEQCLASLQSILNHLFRYKFSQNVESQIQKALGSFYAPLRPISNATKSDIGDQIADLTRKFFHALIRHQLFEKAFCLAIDIGDHDLFMDLYYVAKSINDQEMASAALTRANELIDKENSVSTDSECTHSSCSQCSDSDVEEGGNISDTNDTERQQYTWGNINSCVVPPLPNINIAMANKSISVSSVLPPPLPSVNFSNLPKLQHTITQDQDNVDIQQCTTNSPLKNKNSVSKFTQLGTYNRVFQPKYADRRPDIFTRDHYFSNQFTPFSKTHTITASNTTSSSTTITSATTTTITGQQQSINLPPVPVIVHKTISLNIPPVTNFISANNTTISNQIPLKINVPLNTSAIAASTSTSTSKINNERGEKNVKFSDTVTAFIVPELPRAEKTKRSLNQITNNPFITNPKRELQDSLPLCHPEDEYLKDFTPIANRTESNEEHSNTSAAPKIKVVHFGMV